jgi:hypothetical protein
MPKAKSTPKKSATVAEHGPVVARWESSPILYGWDSRERQTNPEYHAPIRMTAKGVFLTDADQVLDPADVPARILAAAKTVSRDTEYHAPARQEMSLKDAMHSAGIRDIVS